MSAVMNISEHGFKVWCWICLGVTFCITLWLTKKPQYTTRWSCCPLSVDDDDDGEDDEVTMIMMKMTMMMIKWWCKRWRRRWWWLPVHCSVPLLPQTRYCFGHLAPVRGRLPEMLPSSSSSSSSSPLSSSPSSSSTRHSRIHHHNNFHFNVYHMLGGPACWEIQTSPSPRIAWEKHLIIVIIVVMITRKRLLVKVISIKWWWRVCQFSPQCAGGWGGHWGGACRPRSGDQRRDLGHQSQPKTNQLIK